MEPWQLSDKLWDSFKEEGRNLGEKQQQMQGNYARSYGEMTFFNYFLIYVLKNEEAMKSRMKSAVEKSPSVRFTVLDMGGFKNKSILDRQNFLSADAASDTSIR